MAISNLQIVKKFQWLFSKRGGIQFQCVKCQKYMYGWPSGIQGDDAAGRIGRMNIGGQLRMPCGHPECDGLAIAAGGSFLMKRVAIKKGSLIVGEETEWRRIAEWPYFRRGFKCGGCGASLCITDGWIEICKICVENWEKEKVAAIDKALKGGGSGNPQ